MAGGVVVVVVLLGAPAPSSSVAGGCFLLEQQLDDGGGFLSAVFDAGFLSCSETNAGEAFFWLAPQFSPAFVGGDF